MGKKKIVIAIMISYLVISIIGLIITLPVLQQAFYDAIRHYDKDAILIIGTIFLIMIIIIPALLLLVVLRTDERKKNDISIDKDREYIEMQLHELNERLSSTASRWAEINHLILETQNQSRGNDNGIISPEKFLDNFGIDIKKIELKTKQVFVLTPFSSMYNETYEVIKRTCGTLKLNAVRSDEVFTSSNIMKYIIVSIVSSRIVIANIDGRNPNVMYELGIAHALNKPTIIIDQGNQIRPFDIQGNQIVIYDNYDDLAKKLSDQLVNVIVSLE